MIPSEKPFRMLFLCTGNSARSILAEYLARQVAPHRMISCSAGSDPKGEVHPMTIRVLKEVFQIDASDARSKSWDEFQGQDFDFVVTVCDHARETCPLWPGQPIVCHWGSLDPAAAKGTEEEIFASFRNVAFEIRRRLELFASLPFDKLDRLRLESLAKAIGDQ